MKLLAIILILPMAAFAVTVTPLPQSEYADTEVSTNIAFVVERPAMTRIEFTVALDATPTNNVEVAIGTDAYTDWNYAAGNYEGTAAVYNPPAGGIYQVQALVGVGWGAEDERYFRWTVSEPRKIGRRKTGEMKAFGVCDATWQRSLLGCAKRFLWNTEYARAVDLQGEYGFSTVHEDDDKCNYFGLFVHDCGYSFAA